MSATETIWDADAEDFAQELIGHRIVSITEAAIVLDNGVTLVMEDTNDCCAYFGVTEINTSHEIADNVVTSVARRDLNEGEYGESFAIVVLSEAKELACISIDGTESSGYYCRSINLKVTRSAVKP